MTIYTRRGDEGHTSLADGARVSKASARVEAYGTVDEANSAVGFARAAVTDPPLDDVLHFVQQRLFNCSSSMAMPAGHATANTPHIDVADVAFLEHAIDVFQERAGDLNHFVLEAGGEATTRLHVARAIMRRAERRVVALPPRSPSTSRCARSSTAARTCCSPRHAMQRRSKARPRNSGTSTRHAPRSSQTGRDDPPHASR